MLVEKQWLSWAILVFALMLGGGCAVACPQVCSCHDHLSANCSSLPYNGGKLETLTLVPTRETRLELSDGQFNLFKHLKYLTLKNSKIYLVHKKAFYGANKVKEIDLSFNYIEELDPTVFQHLIKLSTLLLRGNPIHLVPGMPFLISNSLSHLDIGQCKIRIIPRGIFYELKRLTHLSLDGNDIKTIEYNSLPKGLKYLDLSNNHIVNVPTEVISALTNLRRLGLAGNPINCSCSLMNFQDWLSGRAIIFEDDVICDSPPNYVGVSWSKVNENSLCLVEARREERLYPSSNLMKNEIYKKPSKIKHFYQDENFQSDQPGSVPDSQVEVFMKNDDTMAMGEMMRDEERTNNNENEEIIKSKDALPSVQIDKKGEEIKSVELQYNVDTTITSDNNRESVEEIKDRLTSETAEPNNLEIDDLNSHNTILKKETDKEKSVREDEVTTISTENNFNSSEITSNNKDIVSNADNNGKGNVENEDIILRQPQLTPLNESNTVEFKSINNEKDLEVDEFVKEGLFHVKSDKYSVQKVEISTANPEVESTTEDESSGLGPLFEDDSNTDLTQQKSESVSEVNKTNGEREIVETVPSPVTVSDLLGYNRNQQNASEHVTKVTESEHISSSPDADSEHPEETELLRSSSTPETEQLTSVEDISETNLHAANENEQNFTDSPTTITETELNTSTSDSDNKHPDENELLKPNNFPEIEFTPVPAITDLPVYETPGNEIDHSEVPTIETNLDLNKQEEEIRGNKVEEMAGAEVVMFCVAILVICLILYSLYKCRGSKTRQNMRNVKDIESNRGTELQDMASLLPKPEADKKNNLKYEEKAPSSETIKLLTEQNEIDTPNQFLPVVETKTKMDDKNSLNNNTANNPSSKVPLLTPEKAVAISPAAPIQRTKVKVGIIADSIPRTPIFVQKTYNGTKNV